MLLVLLRLKPIIRNGRKLTVPGPYGKVGSPRLTMSGIQSKTKPYMELLIDITFNSFFAV